MRVILFVLLLLTAPLAGQTPTYHADIAPLIRRSCMPCHRGDDIGPMALTTYRRVAAYGQMIRYVTRERIMPPFRAVAPTDHFVGERRLSEREIDRIEAWVLAGMPEGKAATVDVVIPRADTLAEADLTISMTESFEQYGVYYDQYRVFVLPTGLTEDRWVEAISFEPGNRSIVRGAMISVDTGEGHQPLDAWDPQYGYYSFGELGFVPEESRWYNWTPGRGPEYQPAGSGKWLPAGARLLAHVHYGPTGVRQRDSSVVRLRWADRPVERVVRTAPLIQPYVMTNDSFAIGAGEVHRIHAKFRVPYDLEITNLFPHAHYLGRGVEVFATLPDGRNTISILKIEDWDFHFKQGYELRQPLSLPAGTVVHALFTYNNTVGNLANPNDPPREVGWGKGMYDEMLLVHFSYRPARDPDNAARFLSGPVLRTDARGTVTAKIGVPGKYRLEIVDFEEANRLLEGDARALTPGDHRFSYDLTSLPYGNYVFRLYTQDDKVVAEELFVYAAPDLFD